MNADIKDNVRRLRDNIADICAHCGRQPSELTLLAATKTRSPQEISECIAAGIRVVGENKVQELCEKHALGAYANAELHFIGTLQSNKARLLVGKAALIHSVATESALAATEKAAAEAGIVQDILLEINIGGEDAKSGLPPERVECFLEAAAGMPHVRTRGLMTVAPLGEKPEPFFESLRRIYEKYRRQFNMDTLSMGMSHDYAAAIEHGSTIVRVGTAIFGARILPK